MAMPNATITSKRAENAVYAELLSTRYSAISAESLCILKVNSRNEVHGSATYPSNTCYCRRSTIQIARLQCLNIVYERHNDIDKE